MPIGTSGPGAIKVGDADVSRVYAGDVLVYDASAAADIQVGGDIILGYQNEYRRVAISSSGSRVMVASPRDRVAEVYSLSGSSWQRVGQTLTQSGSSQTFFRSVAMSSDGQSIAIAGEQGVDAYYLSGASWVAKGGTLSFPASRFSLSDGIPLVLSMSADGSRLVLANASYDSRNGIVWSRDWSGSSWGSLGQYADSVGLWQRGYGSAVAISGDGTRLIVSTLRNYGNVWSYDEASNSGGTYWAPNPSHNQNNTNGTGTLMGESLGSNFGYSLAISNDGSRVAVGAPDSYGVYPLQSTRVGAVHVYDWNGSAYAKSGDTIYPPPGSRSGSRFGYSVALSADGNVLAVGSPRYNGSRTREGRVQAYTLSGGQWEQSGDDLYGGENYAELGGSVALSSDGNILIAGGSKVARVYDRS